MDAVRAAVAGPVDVPADADPAGGDPVGVPADAARAAEVRDGVRAGVRIAAALAECNQPVT